MIALVDIHSHVIPGIDDGPPDLNQSVAMLRAAAQSGVVTIAATPHLRVDFPDVDVHQIGDHCSRLRERLLEEAIDLQLIPGAEVSLIWALEASERDLALASYGQRGTDLLIETPLTTVAGLDRQLYRLRSQGYRITLAHPERAPEFQRDSSALSELAAEGVLVQVNAESLVGDARRAPHCRLGRQLCRDGLVNVLASDGHRAQSWRAVTELAGAAEAAAALVGSERAHWMMNQAPAAIVEGRELPAPPPSVVGERKRRWRRR